MALKKLNHRPNFVQRAPLSRLLLWLEISCETSNYQSPLDLNKEEFNDSLPRSKVEANNDPHLREVRGLLSLSSSPSPGNTGSWLRTSTLQTLERLV